MKLDRLQRDLLHNVLSSIIDEDIVQDNLDEMDSSTFNEDDGKESVTVVEEYLQNIIDKL
jgi:hypothetical protein